MIRFGTAGIPVCAKGRKLDEGIREVKSLGLDCMEVEFVRGVRMSDEAAQKAGEAARELGIALTAHGPYYINLCSKDPAITKASAERILATARKASAFGGKSITFHAAYYQDRDPEKIFRMVAERLREIREKLSDEGIEVSIAPELTGKPTQFGSLEELIRLARKVPGVSFCIDFSHLVARASGAGNGYEGFCRALLQVKKGLSAKALKNLHMHISGIEWGGKGERKHLMLRESRLAWKALLRALVDLEVSGVVICESPVMEDDAILLKKEYQKLVKRKKG